MVRISSVAQLIKHSRVGFIPSGNPFIMQNLGKRLDNLGVNYEILSEENGDKQYRLIVVPSHLNDLTGAWQEFLAKNIAQNVLVFTVAELEETLTGRTPIHHIGDLIAFKPSLNIYFKMKYWVELLVIFISLPLVLLVMLVAGLVIKCESWRSPVFYSQSRVGLGGKEFTIYKFRTMYTESEKDGAQFAIANDVRITQVGKFIRKMRIDELPQFWNVVKGEMSLIGPRPEQKTFVDKFDEEIAFYQYRHLVKPGISGWAQVMQGYTADVDDTQIKLEYDFFYIKHFSFCLDAVIFVKTIKTIFTGFGAR